MIVKLMLFIRKHRITVVASVFTAFCMMQPLHSQKPSVLHIRITNTVSDGKKFQEFIKTSNLLDVRSFKSELLDSNPVLDSALIARALLLAGIQAEFDLVTIPNSAREREMIFEGVADIAGTTQWDFHKKKFATGCWFSDTVIPDGFFEKGLYTTKEKSESIKIISTKDLLKYSFVINRNWIVDWQTLEGLHPKIIYDSPTRKTMFSMVFHGRADITLQGFSANTDLSIEEAGMRLYPVRGVKIVLKGTRHFMINKNKRNLCEVLERGIKIMKNDSSLMTILKQSGFYNTSIDNWKILHMQ